MSRIIQYCVLIIVAIISGSLSQENPEPCTNPEGIEGLCVHILRCPPLDDILQNHASNPKAMDYLRASQCGPDKTRTANVCCMKSLVLELKVELRT